MGIYKICSQENMGNIFYGKTFWKKIKKIFSKGKFSTKLFSKENIESIYKNIYRTVSEDNKINLFYRKHRQKFPQKF